MSGDLLQINLLWEIQMATSITSLILLIMHLSQFNNMIIRVPRMLTIKIDKKTNRKDGMLIRIGEIWVDPMRCRAAMVRTCPTWQISTKTLKSCQSISSITSWIEMISPCTMRSTQSPRLIRNQPISLIVPLTYLRMSFCKSLTLLIMIYDRNHVNTWRDPTEQMTVISMTQRLNKSKFITTIYYKPSGCEEGESGYVEWIMH